MIFGRPGGGKSTFSLWLEDKTNLPLHHVDKFFFKERWVKRDPQEFLTMLEALVAKPQWIIDGNATKTLGVRYRHTDLCLYFCYPRWLCFWRVFKRRFQKRSAIDDRAPNCPERITWKLLVYMWGFEKRVNKILPALQKTCPDVRFVKVKNDRALNVLKNEIKSDISNG